jgi:hypothetical protein
LSSQSRVNWQANDKARSAAFLARDLDAAFVQIHGGLDQIKPDAGSDDAGNIAAAIIALEQPVEIA